MVKVYLKYLLLILIFIFNCCNKDDEPTSPLLSLEEEINKIAEDNLKVGLVIGIINKNQKKITYSYGSKTLNGNEAPDENTTFDIGSMTKTFTAVLLADIFLKGNFTNDTVDHYLPENVKMPTFNGIPIQIIHLATHTSGLPRSPHADGETYPLIPNFNPENPYQNYTTEHIYDYLTNHCNLIFEPGTFWEYSNIGYGLLGHLVGLVNNSTYQDELQTIIFDKLNMNSSSLFLTNEQLANYSLGYNTQLKNVPYFLANDIFQGTGFIKSTLNDLFKYLEANMGLAETTLQDAMELTHQPQLHQGSMGEQGLAWFIITLDDGQTITYSGGDTQGHSSYIGFNKSLSTGVIILSNYAMHGSQLTMGHKILKTINQF